MVEEETDEEEPVKKNSAERRKEEFEELKKENENVEKELLRREQYRAEIERGGKSESGQVEAKTVSPEDSKVNNAKEFFKGTGLGDDISKANKKDE